MLSVCGKWSFNFFDTIIAKHNRVYYMVISSVANMDPLNLSASDSFDNNQMELQFLDKVSP